MDDFKYCLKHYLRVFRNTVSLPLNIADKERVIKLDELETLYNCLYARAEKIKEDLLEFLITNCYQEKFHPQSIIEIQKQREFLINYYNNNVDRLIHHCFYVSGGAIVAILAYLYSNNFPRKILYLLKLNLFFLR